MQAGKQASIGACGIMVTLVGNGAGDLSLKFEWVLCISFELILHENVCIQIFYFQQLENGRTERAL